MIHFRQPGYSFRFLNISVKVSLTGPFVCRHDGNCHHVHAIELTSTCRQGGLYFSIVAFRTDPMRCLSRRLDLKHFGHMLSSRFIQKIKLLLHEVSFASKLAMRSENDSALKSVDVTALEERILMSASPLAAAADVPDTAQETHNASEGATANGLQSFAAASGNEGKGGQTARADGASNDGLTDQQLFDSVAESVLPTADRVEDITTEQTLELVFIDGSISNLDQMIADLTADDAADSSRSLELVVLDSERDAVQQRLFDGLVAAARGQGETPGASG